MIILIIGGVHHWRHRGHDQHLLHKQCCSRRKLSWPHVQNCELRFNFSPPCATISWIRPIPTHPDQGWSGEPNIDIISYRALYPNRHLYWWLWYQVGYELYSQVGCCGAKGVEDYSAQGRSPPQSCLDKFSILSNINDPPLFWIMITKNASILSMSLQVPQRRQFLWGWLWRGLFYLYEVGVNF